MKKYISTSVMALFALGSAHAALEWNGSDDGISLYKEANWTDDNGLTPSNGTINADTTITADTGGLIQITAGTGAPSSFNGDFILGTNTSLEIANAKTLASSSAAAVTASGTATLSLTNGAVMSVGAVSGFTEATVINSSLTLIDSQGMASGDTNGGPFVIEGASDVTAQFLSKWDATLSDSANLTLNGGDNPLNGTTIDFDGAWTGQLYLPNETVADATIEHLGKMTVDDAPAEVGDNVYVVSDESSTGSYVQLFEAEAPAFNEDPFSMPAAKEGVAYSASIAGKATGAGLEYSLLDTGTWLSMDAAGTITGEPAESDVGINTFTVQVTDELARSTNATMTIEVKEVLDPVWTFDYTNNNDAYAAGARVYTVFGPVASVGDGTVMAMNSNPTANNNPGPGFFYIPTGMAWQPNTTYTIDFIVGDRADSADGAILEYGLFDGLPSDDDGAKLYSASAGTADPFVVCTNASLGDIGQIKIVNLGAGGATAQVSELSGSTGSDTLFEFTTSPNVSGLDEMILFIRNGDDGSPTGLRAHLDSIEIYAVQLTETPDPAVLSISYAADDVTIGATNLSSAINVVNYLQYKDDLVSGDSWSNLYSVTGVTETNWTISASNTPAFYRIEATY